MIKLRSIYPTKLFSTGLLILAHILSACGAAKPVETKVSDQGLATSSADPVTKPPPTPIPNLRAEAVLDETFNRYLIRAVDYDPLITVDEFTELQTQGELYLVDLRNPLTIKKEGHIPGAVSIPLRELGQKSSVLPDYTVPIVAYCEEEWQCVIAQVGLGVYGWDIKILEGGIKHWVDVGGTLEQGQILVPEVDPLKPAFPCCGIYDVSVESEDDLQLSVDAPDAALVAAIDRMFDKIPANSGGITAEELTFELEQAADLVLIDLRSPTLTTSEGEIEASNHLHIPFDKLIEYRDRWPANQEVDLIVYSQDEQDSVIAMTILWTYGYRNVRSLIGGYAAWSDLSPVG